MNVVLFGAGGNIGRAIAGELLDRGHAVTGVSRSGGAGRPGLRWVAGDVTDPAAVERIATGHDTAASAVGPRIGVDNDETILLGAARSFIAALPKANVHRLVAVGGAGGLEIAPGRRLIDDAHFPAQWKSNALAQIEALALYRQSSLDWTVVSPAAIIEPGERTTHFRVGGDTLLTDTEGNSRISIADYAIAFVDEIERGNAIRRRITVAY